MSMWARIDEMMSVRINKYLLPRVTRRIFRAEFFRLKHSRRALHKLVAGTRRRLHIPIGTYIEVSALVRAVDFSSRIVQL